MNLEEALAWIAELFEENPDNIRPETPREEVAAWDSLGMLTLMARLDEEFNIIIGEEELSALRKVDDILNILRQKGLIKEKMVL